MQSSHLYRQTGLSFPLFREPFVKSADGSQLRSGRGDFTWADGSSYSGAEPSRFSHMHRVVSDRKFTLCLSDKENTHLNAFEIP